MYRTETLPVVQASRRLQQLSRPRSDVGCSDVSMQGWLLVYVD